MLCVCEIMNRTQSLSSLLDKNPNTDPIARDTVSCNNRSYPAGTSASSWAVTVWLAAESHQDCKYLSRPMEWAVACHVLRYDPNHYKSCSEHEQLHVTGAAPRHQWPGRGRQAGRGRLWARRYALMYLRPQAVDSSVTQTQISEGILQAGSKHLEFQMQAVNI